MKKALWTTLAALLGVAVLLVAGCEDTTSSAVSDAGSTSFKSYKPGSNSGGSAKSEDAASGAGTPTSGGADQAVKVEAGDVARLYSNTLYVLNQWRGLQIVDLTTPAKPKLLARVAMTGTPQEMYVDGQEAVVVLSQVATMKQESGKPVASASSQVRRVSLGSSPQTVASFDVPGTIHASKKVGDKLVVIAPQVSWNPWYWGCWGPYGCMAGGVKEGDSATTGVGAPTSSDSAAGAGASIAYPGGWSGGIQAASTRVLSLDLGKPGQLSEVGHVDVAGGVVGWSIEATEVLIANQDWVWNNDAGSVTERLHQVKLGAGAVPSLGATRTTSTPWSSGGSSTLGRAERIADGRMLLVHQTWTNAGAYGLDLQQAVIDGATWKTASQLTKTNTQYGAQLAIDGQVALLGAMQYAVDQPTGPDKGGDAADAGSTEPDAGIAVDGGSADGGSADAGGGTVTEKGLQLSVLDLADPATIAVAAVAVTDPTTDVWSLQLRHLTASLWLVASRGADYQTQVLRTLDLAQLSAPQWRDSLSVLSGYGIGPEVLSPALLAMPVAGKDATGETMGLRLISVSSEAATLGKLTPRGLFQSQYLYWYQLHNLLTEKLLIRIANPGLEVVDVANLDAPQLLGGLELAAEVMDLTQANGRAVAMVRSWKDGKTWLRVLKAGSTDELDPDGQIQTDGGYGRIYANGNLIYAVDYQAVHVFDVSDPKAPKARGAWQVQQGSASPTEQFWWNMWQVPQQGSTLYLVGTQVTYKQDPDCYSGGTPSTDAAAVDAGSTEPSPPDPEPAVDAGAAAEPDAGVEKDTATEYPEKDGGSTPYCWANPSYATRVAALDLSNPDKPQLGGTVDLADVSWVSNPQVVGKMLVLDHYTSLQGSDGTWYGQYWLDRIDISAPNQPKLKDKINIPGWLVGMAADGLSAVTLDWQIAAGTKPEDSKVENILCGVALANGKATLKSQVKLPDQVGTSVRSGDAVYVSTWPYWWAWPTASDGTQPAIESKLLVFDAKDPAKLAQTASLDPGAGVSWLQVSGGSLFASLGSALGMSVWNLTDPTVPTYQTFLPTQGYWSPRVEVIGGSAYVPAGWYGISAYALK